MSFQDQQQVYLPQQTYDYLNYATNTYSYYSSLDNDLLHEQSDVHEQQSRKRLRAQVESENTRLEHCRICGETKTVGFHHSAITCEACKKFFERQAKGKCIQVKCNYDKGNCVINKNTRNGCSFCRYQKCLSIGMSMEKLMKNNEKSVKNLPCQVCSGPSSGIHFGAITCEGCKSFFKRLLDGSTSLELKCLMSNNCEINFKYPKTCRACRYNRCLKVGMSQDKIKIGRQSNLFKNQLFSNEETVAKPTQMSQSSDVNLDFETNTIINMIHSAFQSSMTLTQEMNLLDSPNDHKIILINFFQQNAYNCAQFIQRIDYFRGIQTRDHIHLVANCVHSLRYLWVAHNQRHLNYFNANLESTKIVNDLYSVYKRLDESFGKIYDSLLKELNLDCKEYSLFAALLVVCGNYQRSCGLSNNFTTVKLTLSNLLGKYMYLRRNESDSYQILISIVPHLVKINIEAQTSLSNTFIHMNAQYNFSSFFKSVYLRLTNVQMRN